MKNEKNKTFKLQIDKIRYLLAKKTPRYKNSINQHFALLFKPQ